MMHTIRSFTVIASLFCVASLADGPAKETLPSAKETLPSANKVIANCIEAMGGEDRIKKIKTVAIQGALEVPEIGLKGTVVVNYREGELQAVSTINGAKTVHGITKSKGWELSPSTDARLTSDAETQQLAGSITMRQFLEPKKYYKQVKNVGKQKVGDEDCFHLRMTRLHDGETEDVFFSIATGLPKRSIAQKETEFGKINVVTTMSDYKTIDEIKTAMKMSSKLEKLGMTYIVVFQSVKYDVPIDDSVFVVPASVQPLLDR